MLHIFKNDQINAQFGISDDYFSVVNEFDVSNYLFFIWNRGPKLVPLQIDSEPVELWPSSVLSGTHL
jgi:hypothetical protein